MAKMTWNDFIKKHGKGYGIAVGFPDYRSGGAIKWSGEKAPTPAQISNALAKAAIKGDYASQVVPGSKSKVVILLIQDANDFSKLSGALQCSKNNRISGPAYISVEGCAIASERYIDLAIRLGLISSPPPKSP